MLLSPFAQYYIRKLLRQNIESLTTLLTSSATDHRLSDASIDKILNDIYLDPEKATTKVGELELLTKLYQELEKNKYDEANLAEIKRRIFHVLGFQTNLTLPTHLPIVVQEESVSLFRFYHTSKIRNGIHHKHEIYGEIRRFDPIHRLQAYQLAWALSEQKVPLILTASPRRFVIWVSLRSPSYAVLLRYDASFLRMLLFLHSTMHKGKRLLKNHVKR